MVVLSIDLSLVEFKCDVVLMLALALLGSSPPISRRRIWSRVWGSRVGSAGSMGR